MTKNAPRGHPSSVEESEERRTARASWPVRKFRLGEEPVDDYSACTVGERMMMVWPMTCDAWASAGRPMPAYSRREMPVRIIRETPLGNDGGEE